MLGNGLVLVAVRLSLSLFCGGIPLGEIGKLEGGGHFYSSNSSTSWLRKKRRGKRTIPQNGGLISIGVSGQYQAAFV